MAADTIKVHFAPSDGGYTAEVKVSTDWEAFKQEVEDEFRRSQQIEIPGDFVLCDLSGSEFGSEIINSGVKLPAELRIKGNTKVSKIFVPVQNKGQMEILAGKIECINALEELVENSVEAVRNVQHKDPAHKGQISGSLGEGTFRFSDNGCGINADDIERVITFGKPLKREDGEGKGISNMLRGNFGRYGSGMKSICKFGIEQKEQVARICSKTSDAQHMLFAEQNYEEIFAGGDYKSRLEYNPELDGRFFSLDGKAGENHFVGSFGTVVDCEKCDANYFDQLCLVKQGKAQLKPEFLRLLAAKYFFYTAPCAFAAIRELVLAVGKEVDAKERNEVTRGIKLNPEALPTGNFEAINISINDVNLISQNNIVLNRVLDMITDASDEGRAAAREALTNNLPFALSDDRKSKTWSRMYKVTNEGKSARVLVLLYFENNEDDNASDLETSDSDDDGPPSSNDTQKQLLVLWNGILFHKENLALPWMAKAKKDAKTNLIKEAFGKVKGLVLLGGEVEPEANKTHLSKDSLYAELQQMKKGPNKSVKDYLVEEYYDQVTKWSEEVNNFHYGPVVQKVQDEYEREWVKIQEATNVKGRKTRRGVGGEYKAARKDKQGIVKEKGTFVEVDISLLRKKGKEKGAKRGEGEGNKKRGKEKGAFGTIDKIMTKTDDDSGKAATAHILIPFADPVVVSVSKIIRPVPPAEEKAILAQVEAKMPSAIKLWVHISDAKELCEEEQQRLNIMLIDGCPYIPICADEEMPTWTLTRNQVAEFQLLAEVVDADGRVVGGGGSDSLVNLKKLNMTFELLDEDDMPIRRDDGEAWTDECSKHGDSATYMTQVKPAVNQRPINHYLGSGRRDMQAFRIRAYVNFQGQNKGLQDFIEKKNPGPPAGLTRTIAVRVIPGPPSDVVVKAEENVWVGEKRLLAITMLDKFNNQVSTNTIESIGCNLELRGLSVDAKLENGKCALTINGKEGIDPLGRPVGLHFQVETAWTDSSSFAKALGKDAETKRDSLLKRVTTSVMSGMPHAISIEGPALQNAPRLEPLDLTVTVRDRWGNPVRGKQGAVTFRLELVPTPGMLHVEAADAEKLEVRDLEEGLLDLKSHLKALVCGEYASTGKLQVVCHTHDTRPGSRAARHPSKSASVDLRVEVAHLSFNMPTALGQSGSDVILKLQSTLACKLSDVKLQIEGSSGAIRTDVTSDDDQLLLKKTRPGAKAQEGDEAQVEVKKGVAAIPNRFICRKEPFDYIAYYCGLTAKLCVRPQHGRPESFQVVHSQAHTPKLLTVGKEWPVYLRVKDVNSVAVTEPCFSVLAECNEGLDFSAVEDSLEYIPAEDLFKVVFTSRGKLKTPQSPATVKFSLCLGEATSPADSILRGEEMGVDISVGPAMQLRFVRNEQPETSFEYVSGEPLRLCIAAVDEHGNVDTAFRGPVQVRAEEDPGLASSNQVLDVELKLKDGTAELPLPKARLFTNAACIQMTAEHMQKRSKDKLQMASCALQVSKGKWPSDIRVEHPGWDGRELTLDDSAKDLVGLKASAVANDGTLIPNARLVLAIKSPSGAAYLQATPSAEDPAIQEFDDCEIPVESKAYDVSIELMEDSEILDGRPKLRRQFKVLRQPGIAHSAVLTVCMDDDFDDTLHDGTILPTTAFYAQVEVRNRLEVPISHRELVRQSEESSWQYGVDFAIDEDNTGLELQWEEVEDGKYKITVEEKVPLDSTTTVSVKGVAKMGGNPIESRNRFTMTYMPQAQMERSSARKEQVVKDINDKVAKLSKLQVEKEGNKEAQRQVDVLDMHLKSFPAAAQLSSDQEGLQRKLAAIERRGSGVSRARWHFGKCDQQLQAVLTARDEARLPAGVHIIGFAGELGYVSAGNALMAKGIAAAAGPNIQALVLGSEQDVDRIENDPGRFAAISRVMNMPMVSLGNRAPSLDPQGLVRLVDPPETALPNGARYAVNQVRFEHLDAPDNLKRRFRLEVWWRLVGSAIIFESVRDLQAFKEKYGRKHVLAAPREDGTWMVVRGMFSRPRQEAPLLVDLRTELPATESTDYRQTKLDLDTVTNDLTKRKEVERQLLLAKADNRLSARDFASEQKDLEAEIAALKTDLASQQAGSLRGKGKQARAGQTADSETHAKKSRRGAGAAGEVGGVGGRAGGAGGSLRLDEVQPEPATPTRRGKRAQTETPETVKDAKKKARGSGPGERSGAGGAGTDAPVPLTRSDSRTRRGAAARS